MPPKIRQLISELHRAGFVRKAGKGSHRSFQHPATKGKVVLAGAEGDDAKPYQVAEVMDAIRESKS